MAKLQTSNHSQAFQRKLDQYKKLIDDDITTYVKQLQKSTLQQFGVNGRLDVDAFLSILSRGGKRIRGSLVMVGYEMSGGQDTSMILEAARAIEMLHAYILIVDDIQDRSDNRRGGPTAHVQLAEYHRKHDLAGDGDHFGVAVALNSALSGAHAANMLLANLQADPELRLKVVSIVNRTMAVTAHGQTGDLVNGASADVTEADVERVQEWKTAYYTFLNPLHVGMVLGGADCSDTDAITDYAKQVGQAYQITNDILGTFGDQSSHDDIREGKRTLLTVYGLEHAASNDKKYLGHMLGNQDLTLADFQSCQNILQQTGALDYAQKQVKQYVEAAIKALDIEQTRWSADGVQFLRGLAEYLLQRQS